jgi:peptidoglycan/LPS O-acetylase OafA/YrhL
LLSPRTGRILSAVGAALLVFALFVTWYHIDRTVAQGDPETTGWQTFERLRILILVGGAFLLASAIVKQTRPVLIARTVVGLVLAALIVRRIIDPPRLDYDVTPAIGVYLGALGALAAAAGGLIDSGREAVEQRPDLAFWRGPAGELPRGSDEVAGARATAPGAPPRGDVVDSTAKEI